MDPLGWINTHDDWTLRQKQTHFYILFSTRQLSVYRLKSRQMSPSWNAFSKPKKTVASGILWIKIKKRILTFSTGRQKGINGVLYESRTGMSWAVATRAHVSTVKFTSGSRLRSSRPRILRSLVATILREVDLVGVQQRRRCRLSRRKYVSYGPNFCWHVDGNFMNLCL